MSYTVSGDDLIIHLPKAGDITVAREDIEDMPVEAFDCMLRAAAEDFSALADLPRALSIDTAGWRQSDLMELVASISGYADRATEMTLPEDSGSEVTSEPTASKSSMPASKRG